VYIVVWTSQLRFGFAAAARSSNEARSRLLPFAHFLGSVVFCACFSLFSRKGLLTREDETMLNRIYSYNSLLFDFCLKRSVRG
jgi:hypothetical protein